jgi:phage-related minor tail protein
LADGAIVIETRVDQRGAQQGLNELQNRIQSVGQKMKDVGTALTKSVTTPVVALGTGAVAMATSFDDSMRKVEATMGSKLGKTTQEVEANVKALRDEAKRLGSTTAFSASEAAGGMEKLALAQQVLCSI